MHILCSYYIIYGQCVMVYCLDGGIVVSLMSWCMICSVSSLFMSNPFPYLIHILK